MRQGSAGGHFRVQFHRDAVQVHSSLQMSSTNGSVQVAPARVQGFPAQQPTKSPESGPEDEPQADRHKKSRAVRTRLRHPASEG